MYGVNVKKRASKKRRKKEKKEKKVWPGFGSGVAGVGDDRKERG